MKFFIENGSQIMALVQSIIDSLAAIAAGDVGFVAKAVENAMASAVPVLIGFLASLLGIDGLADKVQDIIKNIRKRIDDVITGLIDKAKDWFKGKGKDKRKAESEDDVTEEDRAKHEQYANEIETELKGMKPKEGENFADFRQRVQARANALEKQYQPKLTDGIKIDISLTNSAKEDEKDGDVDIETHIYPNAKKDKFKVKGKDSGTKIGANSKKMSDTEIGVFFGDPDWHKKNKTKTNFLKKFKKQMKGATNADFYIDKKTKEVLLKTNKGGHWIQTGEFIA